MIRETQKAVREYYKEGMYQVRGQVDFRCASVQACKRRVLFKSDMFPVDKRDETHTFRQISVSSRSHPLLQSRQARLP